MSDFSSCAAIKAYKIGKAVGYIRKAFAILDELEDMNAKIDGDFHAILEYCSWLTLNYRQRTNMQMKEQHEN